MEYSTEYLLTYQQFQDRKALYHNVDTTSYMDHEVHVRERVHRFLTNDPNITEVYFTCPWTDTFNPADALIISAGTPIHLEVKERSFASSAFSTWIIEEKKLDRIRHLERSTGIPAVWCALFPDDVAMIWSLSDHTGSESINCHYKSFQQDLGKVDKTFLHFPSSAATQISL